MPPPAPEATPSQQQNPPLPAVENLQAGIRAKFPASATEARSTLRMADAVLEHDYESQRRRYKTPLLSSSSSSSSLFLSTEVQQRNAETSQIDNNDDDGGGFSSANRDANAAAAAPSTSFTTKKINATTFVIREDDAYGEHPLIYVKLHPRVPVIVLSDTGCDEPSEAHKDDHYTQLRSYIETYPLECNNNAPLNPEGYRQYFIICTHCHYDHISGITQFLAGGTTEIIASSAGRNFIESDLDTHGLFNYIDKPAPWYQVTYYAESLERLKWPIWHKDEGEPKPYQSDLGVEILHTPGHTPDELAWYDREEMGLYVGDSFYEEGEEDGMAILFPAEGNLVEWVFSMQKLLVFVRSENALAEKAAEESNNNSNSQDSDDWQQVAKRVKVSCAHQTTWVDGEEILERLEKFSARVYQGNVPVIKKEYWHGDAYYTWREENNESKISLKAPARLMDKARSFFNLYS